MSNIRTEHVVIDASKGTDEEFGVYATDEGTIEVVVRNEGVKHVATFTPEQWARVAIAGIELGVVARSAAAQKDLKISPAAIARGAIEHGAKRLHHRTSLEKRVDAMHDALDAGIDDAKVNGH
jgi:hypothetical protein